MWKHVPSNPDQPHGKAPSFPNLVFLLSSAIALLIQLFTPSTSLEIISKFNWSTTGNRAITYGILKWQNVFSQFLNLSFDP